MVNSWNSAIIGEKVSQGGSGGGGSSLPSVTSEDNGKVLGVVNGAWDKMAVPSGGVNYSTTEQDTGIKWLDGKPIYQRTYSGTTTSTRTEIADFTDNLIDIKGNAILTYVGDIYKFAVPGYPGDQNPLRFVPFILANKLVIDASSGLEYNVTIFYTKNS